MISKWFAAPPDLLLNNHEVHIWRCCLKQSVQQIELLKEVLSDDEVKRADRFYFVHDRSDFITARGVLRMILGRYLDMSPKDISFRYGPGGKPLLAVKQETGLCFNISHSAGIALYSFAVDRKIGIDIESIDRDRAVMHIAERFFSASEISTLQSLPVSEQQGAFFTYWTCKEAFLKAEGTGLSFGLEKVEISVTPEKNAVLAGINGDAQAAASWSLHTLDAAPLYAAALAVNGDAGIIRCWQWDFDAP